MEPPKIVVYSMNVRLAYIGELVADNDDVLILRKALFLEREINPQTGEQMGVSIGAVPYASRESNVSISKKTSPGVLIDNPAPEVLKAYDKEIIACYSALKLA